MAPSIHVLFYVALDYLYTRNPFIFLSFCNCYFWLMISLIIYDFWGIRRVTVYLNTPSRDVILLDTRQLTYILINQFCFNAYCLKHNLKLTGLGLLRIRGTRLSKRLRAWAWFEVVLFHRQLKALITARWPTMSLKLRLIWLCQSSIASALGTPPALLLPYLRYRCNHMEPPRPPWMAEVPKMQDAFFGLPGSRESVLRGST